MMQLKLTSLKPIGSPDLLLLTSVFSLAFLGIILVASSSIELSAHRYSSPYYFSFKHCVFLFISFCSGLVAYLIPTRCWYRYSNFLLVSSVFLLVLVLIIGREVNGAQRWIQLGSLNLQPSEFSKFTVMVFMATYLFRHLEEVRKANWIGFIKPLLVVLSIAVLIFLGRDFGTFFILFCAVLGVLFLAGAPFVKFLVLVFSSVAASIWLIVSEPYRYQRLTVFLDPWDKDFRFGDGYQMVQSIVAFGRGDWIGMGLGNSVQKLFYLPEAHTDFIFAILAEEMGFLGALSTIFLMGLLIWRSLLIGRFAEVTGRPFAAYLVYGLALLLGVQIFLNLAVNVGLAPTTGIPLPLLSYGGSSLLVTAVGLGVIARVSADLEYLR